MTQQQQGATMLERIEALARICIADWGFEQVHANGRYLRRADVLAAIGQSDPEPLQSICEAIFAESKGRWFPTRAALRTLIEREAAGEQQQGALRAAALEALYEACSYAGLAAHDLAGPMEKHNARDMYDEAKRAIEALAALAGEHEPAAPALTEPTDKMIAAYLAANERYWREADQLLTPPDRWRHGTVNEATRVSLRAALAAAIERPAQPEPTLPIEIYGKLYDVPIAVQVHIVALEVRLEEALATPAPGEQPANPSEGPEGREPDECALCGRSMSTPPHLEPTEICNLCAQDFYAKLAALTPSEAPSAKEAPISAALLSEVLAKLDDDDLVRRVQDAWGGLPIAEADAPSAKEAREPIRMHHRLSPSMTGTVIGAEVANGGLFFTVREDSGRVCPYHPDNITLLPPITHAEGEKR